MQDGTPDGEGAFRHPLALLALSGVALGLVLLPAAVGTAILLGWTVPLEFGAGVVLALGAVKVGAAAWGVVAAIAAPRPVDLASDYD